MAKACSHMATPVHSNAWTGAYRPLNRQTTEIIAVNRYQSNLVKSIVGKEYLFVSPTITGEQVQSKQNSNYSEQLIYNIVHAGICIC